jgi:hypothetical protein
MLCYACFATDRTAVAFTENPRLVIFHTVDRKVHLFLEAFHSTCKSEPHCLHLQA